MDRNCDKLVVGHDLDLWSDMKLINKLLRKIKDIKQEAENLSFRISVTQKTQNKQKHKMRTEKEDKIRGCI